MTPWPWFPAEVRTIGLSGFYRSLAAIGSDPDEAVANELSRELSKLGKNPVRRRCDEPLDRFSGAAGGHGLGGLALRRRRRRPRRRPLPGGGVAAAARRRLHLHVDADPRLPRPLLAQKEQRSATSPSVPALSYYRVWVFSVTGFRSGPASDTVVDRVGGFHRWFTNNQAMSPAWFGPRNQSA